jgi:hypothetical protein
VLRYAHVNVADLAASVAALPGAQVGDNPGSVIYTQNKNATLTKG